MMLPYLFVLLAVAIRFLPHPWHFTPLAASLLFFGARGSRRQMWIPLVLVAATDVILTKYIYAYHFTWEQLIIWAWYAAILWLGTNLREKAGFWRVVGAAVTSSVSFFVVSNFAAWVAMPQIYPRSIAGVWPLTRLEFHSSAEPRRAIYSAPWQCLARPHSCTCLPDGYVNLAITRRRPNRTRSGWTGSSTGEPWE